MARFFSYDNSFMTGLNKICDCMILGFFWTFCSIPIFTVVMHGRNTGMALKLISNRQPLCGY